MTDMSFVQVHIRQIDEADMVLKGNLQKIALLTAENCKLQAQIDWQMGVIAAHTGVVSVESKLTEDDKKIVKGYMRHVRHSQGTPQCDRTQIQILEGALELDAPSVRID
ncbi:hypothetical protein [Laspinema olomoucense]|uniref:hypothetical protein n=1 Tax=Laspinema olomoucense TaxID=3231600 RepID=UPI0021BB7551|nr:hypothetical protein [Laspinema sp. D3d]MCT7971100.1 hypothetical protein [Laspinema sp. D3d]